MPKAVVRAPVDAARRLARDLLPPSARERLRQPLQAVGAARRRLRRKQLSAVGLEELVQGLREAGIEEGDVVMAHSSLSAIGNVEGGPQTVIASLQLAVGPSGTLLMPTFVDSDDVLERARAGDVIDLRTQRSGTGAITEAFRLSPGVRRSSHPFSSVAAWGRHADEVTSRHAEDPRIAHAASPMAQLLPLKGKIVGLGMSISRLSFYHVVEDTWPEFPLRLYREPEEVSYIDAEGAPVTRQITRYGPAARGPRIDQPDNEWLRRKFAESFTSKGILRWFSYGDARSWVADAEPLYEEMKRMAAMGMTIYLTEERWLAEHPDDPPW